MNGTSIACLLYLIPWHSSLFYLQSLSLTPMILIQIVAISLITAALLVYHYRSKIKVSQYKIDRCIRELVTQTIQYDHVIELVYEIKYELDSHNPDCQSMSEDLKRKIEATLDNQLEWKKFMRHFEEVHPRFYSKLTKVSDQITQNELRLCSYIRIGLTNKEIASLLNTTSKSVEMAKYRLKKTLKLSEAKSLVQYIRSL